MSASTLQGTYPMRTIPGFASRTPCIQAKTYHIPAMAGGARTGLAFSIGYMRAMV